MSNTALVTGGAKRIGAEIAIYLARLGWDILLHYFQSEDEAICIKQKIEKLGRSCNLWQHDFSTSNDIPKLAVFKEVALLVNNASHFKSDNIYNIDRINFSHTINTNLLTPILLMQKLLHMNLRNVINILDSTINERSKVFLSYNIANNSMKNFIRIAASNLPSRVKINGITLGYTMKGTKESSKHFDSMIKAFGDPIKVSEICKTIQFIISSTTTGEIICINNHY